MFEGVIERFTHLFFAFPIRSVQVNKVTNAVILILVTLPLWSLLVEVGAFRYDVFVSVPVNQSLLL